MTQTPDDITVSVCMITYNHDKFIRQAIDGVLMQRTNFPLELVIGEDFSQDNTRNICEIYAKKHLDIINLLPSNKNLGIMPNFIRTLQACKGKYIAICEGDDYWLDEQKLQIQVDHLKANENLICSFHQAEVIGTDGKKRPFCKSYGKKVFNGSDLLNKWYIPTASMVFKNVLPENMPDFFRFATHGDLALQLYLSQFGQFGLIERVMSVYRLNNSSVTVNSFQGINHNLAHIRQLHLMIEYFNGKYSRLLLKRMANYHLSNAILYSKIYKLRDSYCSLVYSIRSNPFVIFNFRNLLSWVFFFLKSLVFKK